MKKPDTAQKASAAQSGCPDEAWAKRYPKIVEMLATVQWEDGTSREASALSVTLKDGMLQVALNDKALKQSLYTSAGSLAEAMKLMESVLADGTAPWRTWKAGKGR